MKVSVVIPVFNAAGFVAEAVESALAQPETGEVLLVEDGSGDDSLAVCERLAAGEPRVRLLRHANGENRGAGASRNLGIESAACPLVAFLDADDVFLPGWLAEAAAILVAQPDVDGVYGEVEIRAVDEASRKRLEASGWPDRISVRRTVGSDHLFEALVSGGAGSFHTDGIVVRRGLFEKSGVFDPRFRTAQDTHLWIRLAATGRLVPGPKGVAAARCRIHAGNRVTGRPRRDYVEGVHRVWADLMRWGGRKKLPAERRRLLARRYMAAARGMLLGQPLFQAWKTAAGALAFLMGHCPRPWRVAGFRELGVEASGIGLGFQRAVDRIVYGPPRPVPAGLPSLVFVNLWFGPWPLWMRAYLLSCAKNPTVDWLIFSDSEPPADVPGNVKILPMALDTFTRRATQVLGFKAGIDPGYAYKACDFKPMTGSLFAPELKGYDFWSWCDMDVVWGDLRRFLTPELLARHDVITSRPGKISGHFTLVRNRPEWSELFRRIPDVAARAGESRVYRRIDEDGLTAVLRRTESSLWRRLWTRRVRGLPVPRVYWEKFLAPNGRHQRQMVKDGGLAMRWREGRTFDVDGEEMMYLHFHKIRDTMKTIDFGPGDSPREFTVTPKGFFAVNEGVR